MRQTTFIAAAAITVFLLTLGGLTVSRHVLSSIISSDTTSAPGRSAIDRIGLLLSNATSPMSPQSTATDVPNRRKFVSYTSSPWEQLWLDNVERYERKREICSQVLGDQSSQVHDFMNLTCTYRFKDCGWCMIHDEYEPVFYNTANRETFELTFNYSSIGALDSALDIDTLIQEPVRPGPEHAHIVSKFVFYDELLNENYTEYIEPLVSHLRHPLSMCLDDHVPTANGVKNLLAHRGYVLPIPSEPRISGRKLYFDAGASSWNDGIGGPSLSYFTNMWGRHGVAFDRIQAYEMTTSEESFYKTVPEAWRSRVEYRQCAVASSSNTSSTQNPFLPNEIRKEAQPNDYVFFKLDIDSPLIESGSVEYILDHMDDIPIHEFAWEHHVVGNYLLKRLWSGRTIPYKIRKAKNISAMPLDRLSLRESYDFFLKLRQGGIRAHSWI